MLSENICGRLILLFWNSILCKILPPLIWRNNNMYHDIWVTFSLNDRDIVTNADSSEFASFFIADILSLQIIKLLKVLSLLTYMSNLLMMTWLIWQPSWILCEFLLPIGTKRLEIEAKLLLGANEFDLWWPWKGQNNQKAPNTVVNRPFF